MLGPRPQLGPPAPPSAPCDREGARAAALGGGVPYLCQHAGPCPVAEVGFELGLSLRKSHTAVTTMCPGREDSTVRRLKSGRGAS